MSVRVVTNTSDVTCHTSVASSTEIPYESAAGGMIYVPTGSTLTSLTFWTAENDGGTYIAAYDQNNTAVTMTVAAARAYPFPTALFGAAAIKIVGNAIDTVEVVTKS